MMSIVRVGFGFQADVLRRPHYTRLLSSLDILLLPELADGGYAALQRGAPPHTLTDPLISTIRTASHTLPCSIVAGSLFLNDGDIAPTNSTLVFARGKLLHRYDKIHLFKPTNDPRYFQPGKLDPTTFTLRIGSRSIRGGVVICYDLRFPELVRAMALKGMDVLFVPARWPRVRDNAWQTLLRARAIENQIFVLGCNATGKEGGYSYAFDPLGNLIASNRRRMGSALLTFSLDLGALRTSRKMHDNLKDAVFLKQFINKHSLRPRAQRK
jgi:predicted amidohydrolase